MNIHEIHFGVMVDGKMERILATFDPPVTEDEIMDIYSAALAVLKSNTVEGLSESRQNEKKEPEMAEDKEE